MTLAHLLTIAGILVSAVVAVALARAVIAQRRAEAALAKADQAAKELAAVKALAGRLEKEGDYWRKAVQTIEREGCARLLSCPDRQSKT